MIMLSMETMMKKQKLCTNTSSPLNMNKNSHLIAKVKPKIRIIHIFAPEVIKTDVANFRQLVQRLTGKPTADDHYNNKNNKKATPRLKRVEIRSSRFLEFRERIKRDEEIWEDGIISQNNGGYLGGFADLDGFMQELNNFQMLPIDAGPV